MHDRRGRSEVRFVDRPRRRYVFIASSALYAEACLMADLGCEDTDEHHVVWDSDEERVLYDSRQLR